MITKSDFLIYLEAPLHLWAKKHGKYNEQEVSDFEKHLASQGYEVENLAQEFLTKALAQDNYTFSFQTTLATDNFRARIDAFAYDQKAKVYDIYEIKSTSEVKKEHIWDVGFQKLVAEKTLPIRSVSLVILNKEYVRIGKLDLSQLFLITPQDKEIEEQRKELENWMKDCVDIEKSDNPNFFDSCIKPKDCPCLSICHPNLPSYSIFDIRNIHKSKAHKLKEEGILDITNVPDDFKLSKNQTLQVKAAKENKTIIDKTRIKNDLNKLVYPLYFLDYETFNCALPIYDNYHPHQQMTFQYSLHIVADNQKTLTDDTQIIHKEFISTDQDDPAKLLCENLKNDIGDTGSVLVWNKTFEKGRNKEMVEIYPEYKDFLTELNERVYDLADSFRKCWYVDPLFKGSWSIKNILPVLVPELTYKNLVIGKGDQAMLAWWKMIYGVLKLVDIANGKKTPRHPELVSGSRQIKQDLFKYCELDTWAMVEIWRKLCQL